MLLIFGSGDMAQAVHKRIDSIMLPEESCDITIKSEVERAIRLYNPDTVINCAGVLEPDDWEHTIDVNLTGSYNVAIESSGRRIILIASTAGLHGKKDDTCYCASKAGVISIMQSLAMMGEDIYCISPARIDSSMRDSTHPDEDKSTRLDMNDIVDIVEDILEDNYDAGDNIIVKKDWDIITDKGEPWRKKFNLR